MSSTTTLYTPADIEAKDEADDMARAVFKRAMVQRLSSLGMRMVEELAERVVDTPYHPEPRHEPGRSFAAISRSVRLSIVLEIRVDAQVIAMRKGLPVPGFQDPFRNPRAPAADAARETVEKERGDPATEADARDRQYECLVDREDHDEVLDTLPFDACVGAIRSGLNLPPLYGEGRDEAPRSPAWGSQDHSRSPRVAPACSTPLGRAESALPMKGREEKTDVKSPPGRPSP